MAYFEGTIEEFTKFIGAYARIKVMHISSKFKLEVDKCQECGLTTKSLDAAHINGYERPLLISNILSEFMQNGLIKIDLYEFEERFIAAHQPINKTIRILCKECHRKYDSLKNIHETLLEHSNGESSFFDKVKDSQEGRLIERLVKEKVMNKGEAIRIAQKMFLPSLTNSNTIYSNINAAQDVWWLQPNNEKFRNDLYFILNNDRNRTLYYLKMPSDTISNPANYFRQRNDDYRNNCSDIYISVSSTQFIEKRGYDFSRLLIKNLATKYLDREFMTN